jgi:hypothetical protein
VCVEVLVTFVGRTEERQKHPMITDERKGGKDHGETSTMTVVVLK